MKDISITSVNKSTDRYSYWLTRPPEERVEAVEIIREQYYSMPGYEAPPPMEKTFKIIKVR